MLTVSPGGILSIGNTSSPGVASGLHEVDPCFVDKLQDAASTEAGAVQVSINNGNSKASGRSIIALPELRRNGWRRS
jgi:hypothetical protein